MKNIISVSGDHVYIWPFLKKSCEPKYYVKKIKNSAGITGYQHLEEWK